MTPVLYILFAYLAGLVVSLSLSPSPAFLYPFLGLPFFLLVFFRRKKIVFQSVALCIFFCAGLLYPALIRQMRLKVILPVGQTVSFKGVVLTDPDEQNGRFSFLAFILEINGSPSSVRLSVSYQGERAVFSGARISGYGRIRRSSSSYALSRNLMGSLSVRYLHETGKVRNFYSVLHEVRERAYKAVTYGIQGEEKNLIANLLLGRRKDVSLKVQQVFSNSGTIHVLAVSGLHLAIIALFLFFLLDRLPMRRSVKLIALSIFILAYVLMIGRKPSILRAALMTWTGIAVYLTDRDRHMGNVVGFSALVLLLFNPFLVRDIGFQLSYSAVIGILAFHPLFSRLFRKFPVYIRESFSASLSAQMAVLPLVILYFHKIVWVSFLANLVMIPLVTVIIGLGLVSGLLSLFSLWKVIALVNILNSFLARITVMISTVFARFFLFRIENFDPVICLSLFGLLFLFFLMIHQKKNKRLVGMTAVIVLLLFSWGMGRTLSSGVKVTVLNCGRGRDALHFQVSGRKDILIMNTDFQGVQKKILPYLGNHTVDALEGLILLTGHEKNYEAASLICSSLPVKQVWTPLSSTLSTPEGEKFLSALGKSDLNFLDRSVNLKYGPVSISVLNPPVDEYLPWKNISLKRYRNSAVIRLTSGKRSFLISGPVDSYAWEKCDDEKKRADIVYAASVPSWIPSPVLSEPEILISSRPDIRERIPLEEYREICVFLRESGIKISKTSW